MFFPDQQTLVVNILDYGADPTGVKDSTSAITAAIAALSAGKGGEIYAPAGIYRTGSQILASDMMIRGDGPGITTFLLNSGTNSDLFHAYTQNINLSGAPLSGSPNGVMNFGFSGVTLDGNKNGQTGGTSYPLRFYGYACTLTDVEILHGYTGGVLTDWNNTPDPDGISICNHWKSVQIHDNNGIGIECGGPTDCKWLFVDSYKNGSHNYHLAPNAVGYTWNACHGWKCPTGVRVVTALIEAGGTYLSNCQMEGSDIAQIVVIANDVSIIGGQIFPGDIIRGSTTVGVQIGQQYGQTPYSGQILQSAGVTTYVQPWTTHICCKIDDCWAGAIDYNNEKHTSVYATIYQSSGNVLHNGHYPDVTDTIIHQVSGLTPDGSANKGSMFHIGASSSDSFVFFDKNGNQLFNIDGWNSAINIPNNTTILGWNGNYSSITYQIHGDSGNIQTPGNIATSQFVKLGSSSSLYSGSGAPSNSVGSSGDYYFRTDTPGSALQRIYVNSSGSWIGVI